MKTSIIIVLIVFILGNIAGLTLHAIYCKKTDTAFTWYETLWMLICGITYIPKGIVEVCSLKKK